MGWPRKRTQLQAYFAGLFDGEGHVGISSTTKQLQVSMSMTDPQAIALIKREYPEFYLTYRRNRSSYGKPNKPQATLQLSQHSAYRFLDEIKPFVIVKWEQVSVGLSFLVHRRREARKHTHSAKACDYCLHCEDTVRALKNRNNGVKTVEALARHGLRQYRAKPEDVERDCEQLQTIVKGLWESVETSGEPIPGNKPISAPAQDIVHLAA